jgi:hypothetical protein
MTKGVSMWQWFEHYGMALSLFALSLAGISILFGVYRKKKNLKEGNRGAGDPTGIYLKLAGILAGIAVLSVIATAVTFERIQLAKENGPFSFGSGWIFFGYYDQAKKTYLTGPFEKITMRNGNNKGDGNLPGKGDQLEVLQPSKVYIPYYPQLGGAHQYDCPISIKDVITKTDETGLILKPETQLAVKDVFTKRYTQNGISVWARVEKTPA